MRTSWLRTWVLIALGPALAAGTPTGSDGRRTNKLEGIVVFKDDGRPAAGVPVVMAQGDKGYIYFSEDGLSANGERETVLQYFAKPNAKHFCEAVTDNAGRFSFAGFAAADQPWTVAAGEPQSGFALRTGVCPQDYGETPLKIELEKPAFLNVIPPRAPARSLRVTLNVALAPTTPPAEPTEAGGGPGTQAAETERVYFNFTPPPSGSRDKPQRFGPLPGGQKYKVTASAYSTKLSYQPTLSERVVALASGATVDVALGNTEGATVSGTVTSVDEKPLPAVNVMVKAADGVVVGALTDEAGKYELRGVPPGTHKLELLRHAKRMVPG
jgi:hypothetical protein